MSYYGIRNLKHVKQADGLWNVECDCYDSSIRDFQGHRVWHHVEKFFDKNFTKAELEYMLFQHFSGGCCAVGVGGHHHIHAFVGGGCGHAEHVVVHHLCHGFGGIHVAHFGLHIGISQNGVGHLVDVFTGVERFLIFVHEEDVHIHFAIKCFSHGANAGEIEVAFCLIPRFAFALGGG